MFLGEGEERRRSRSRRETTRKEGCRFEGKEKTKNNHLSKLLFFFLFFFLEGGEGMWEEGKNRFLKCIRSQKQLDRKAQ